ncbi:MAG: hypothetical protein MUC36_00860 [Planctomycetes bacterium]|jgi:hypothetical protein|nr:hypothetical protein [Planctomycetota bacterium]
MNAAALLELSKQLLRRAMRSDFQREHATDQERAELAAQTPPTADPLAQDYVAWRRAVLWIAGIVLVLAACIAVAEHKTTAQQVAQAQMAAMRAQAAAEGQELPTGDLARLTTEIAEGFGKQNLEILDGLGDFLLFLKIAVATLVMIAAVHWRSIRRSRNLVRWAWLTALVLPLLVSVYPWAQSLDFSHLNQQNMFGQVVDTGKVVKQQIGLALAATLMSTLLPKLIALFPGIIRSSMVLKTLLPEAAAPGWLTVVFAPFLAGFLLLVLSFLSQSQGSWVLLAAMLSLCAAPVIYVRRAADLVRPHTAEEVGAVVGSIRRLAGATNTIGYGLLIWYVLDFDELSWTTAIHLLLEAGGGILMTMVVISDITIALLAFSQRQGALFQGSGLRAAYEHRLQALSGAGLTNVESVLGIKDLDNLRKVGRGGSD